MLAGAGEDVASDEGTLVADGPGRVITAVLGGSHGWDGPHQVDVDEPPIPPVQVLDADNLAEQILVWLP